MKDLDLWQKIFFGFIIYVFIIVPLLVWFFKQCGFTVDGGDASVGGA